MTGRNATLQAELAAIHWEIPAHIYGFVDNMPELMHAADLLVTKAGPGTISEALIAGLPMILADFIPGQETGNVQFVEENGVGRYVPDAEAIADLVQEWCTPGQPTLATMASNAVRLARPRAALLIAEDLCFTLEHAPVEAAVLKKEDASKVTASPTLAHTLEVT